MKKEKIESKQLQRLIVLKAGKLDYSEITDEDFDSITELYLDRLLLNGKPSGITLDLIDLFPNLVELSISNFEINQADIEKLKLLGKLNTITLSRCIFNDVDISSLENKNISFIGCESIGIKLPRMKSVVIRGSRIDFRCIDFESVTDITIQESKIYNVRSLKDYPNIRNINLDGSILYSNFEDKIPDVEVSEKTKYSHSIESEINDPHL